jgi:hypothetical protein
MAGDMGHAEFREVVDMLRTDANLVATATESPEVAIFFHSRPLSVNVQVLQYLRQAAPLAAVVVVAGSWCEGEPRTGHAWPGVHRHYWYEFPTWWRRQMRLRFAGNCPDWARPPELVTARTAKPTRSPCDAVVLRTAHTATAETLADRLTLAGYSTVLQMAGKRSQPVGGAAAGIWDGNQLDNIEAQDLSRFCMQLGVDGAPVIALLDFPRRDAVDRAIELGAAAVLGKPWLNVSLLLTLEQLIARRPLPIAA